MKKSGFTLIEMLVVIAILGILAAAMMSGLSKARLMSWRTHSRDCARQLAEAWNLYLLDEREFPEELAKKDSDNEKLRSDARNLGLLNASKVYFDTSKEESNKGATGATGNGIKDHWGNFYYFSLDTNYDGKIANPAYIDRKDFKNTAFSSEQLTATAIAWSTGETVVKSYKIPASRYLVSW